MKTLAPYPPDPEDEREPDAPSNHPCFGKYPRCECGGCDECFKKHGICEESCEVNEICQEATEWRQKL